MACCANFSGCEGYFWHNKSSDIVKGFSSSCQTTTKLLAKFALSCMARFMDIDMQDTMLHTLELKFLFLLMSHAVQDEDAESNGWPVYTLTTPHHLHFILTLCYNSLCNLDNARALLENAFVIDGKHVTMLGILVSVFQKHSHPLLLERALCLLERLSLVNYPNVIIEVQDNYPELLKLIQSLLCSCTKSLQQCVFFCLRSFDFATLNITGLYIFLIIHVTIIESIDSICRDGADTP